MLRTEQFGIVVEPHPFDQGYWARFNGEARPARGERRKGWDECDTELRFDRSETARTAANIRWKRTANGGAR